MTKEKLDKLVEKIGGRPFGVNGWGSSQYTGAINFFDTLEALTKAAGKKKGVVDRATILKKLGLKVTYTSVVPLNKAWAKFKRDLTKQYGIKKLLESTTPSIDNMFDICRSQSYDLWSAAPYIASLLFKDLKVETPAAPGVGPLWNVEAQSENYNTGLLCWLLYNEGLVKDPEAFAGFDT